MILLIVTVGVLWLLAHGYPSGTALAIMGSAGMITTEFLVRVMHPLSTDR